MVSLIDRTYDPSSNSTSDWLPGYVINKHFRHTFVMVLPWTISCYLPHQLVGRHGQELQFGQFLHVRIKSNGKKSTSHMVVEYLSLVRPYFIRGVRVKERHVEIESEVKVCTTDVHQERKVYVMSDDNLDAIADLNGKLPESQIGDRYIVLLASIKNPRVPKLNIFVVTKVLNRLQTEQLK